MKWISQAYLKNGNQELADYYIEKELEYWDSYFIGLNPKTPWEFMQRAMALAYRGMKEEALTVLRELNDLMANQYHYLLGMMTDWPFFDGIRDDPEFQKILNDMEAKYQAEHERVRQWLEENDML